MTAYPDQPWSRRVDSDDAGSPRTTPLSPAPPAEPLTYQTVIRPSDLDGPLRPRRSTEREVEPAPEAAEGEDAPRYRPRDYSPEGRRAVPTWAPSYSAPYGGQGERLDYHTLTRAELRAAVDRESHDGHAASDSAGGTASDSTESSDEPRSTPDQPLTRRQLRALREAQEAAAASGGVAAPPAQAFHEEPVPAEPEAVAAEPVPAEPEAVAVEPEATQEEPAPAEPEQPSWAGSAPATFAIPVIQDPTATPAEPVESAAAPVAPVQSLDEWVAQLYGSAPASAPAESAPAAAPVESAPAEPAPASAFAAPPVVQEEPAPQAAPVVPQGPPVGEAFSLPEPPGAAQPVEVPELVEPPETAPVDASSVPSVFQALFAPTSDEPTTDDTTHEPTPDTAPEPADARPAPQDPLAFLDAAPAASERVDLPAPTGWTDPLAAPAPPAWTPPVPTEQEPVAEPVVAELVPEPVVEEPQTEEPEPIVDVVPTVVGEPPVEPPGSRPEAEAPEESGEGSTARPVVLDVQPLPAEPIVPPTGPVATGTTGHWAAQAAYDDSTDAYIAGRDVGGGHGVVTTNALVLPSLPQTDLGPLSTTGEIVVTGSIEVPRSLSSTGAHATQLDQSHLDHQLDPGDEQVVSLDSQPVRAIKAVSTHTSTRGMMTASKSSSNRGLTVLIVVTAGLALVVGAVLVVGLINHAF